MKNVVLVGVLKDKRDLEILLNKFWYRIPVSHAPKRRFDYLAFYQPLEFAEDGKCIRYFAKIKNLETLKRIELIPDEPEHKLAQEPYRKFSFAKIHQLKEPIRSVVPRRVSFGYTTLEKLKHSKDMLELYSIAPTEQIIQRLMLEEGIWFCAQYYVILSSKKRYRLDFAIFCNKGKIAIECDNQKAHKLKEQKILDREKDLILKSRNWKVLRLTEKKIVFKPEDCRQIINCAISKLGGLETEYRV
jgi:very-short-patch-repair endonuclease